MKTELKKFGVLAIMCMSPTLIMATEVVEEAVVEAIVEEVAQDVVVHRPDINLIINDQVVNPIVNPVQVNDITLIPVRTVAEHLGASIDWLAETQTIMLQKGGTTIELWFGNTTAKVNGQSMQLSTAPVEIYGQAMIPLRFVSDALNVVADWDVQTSTILINSSTDSLELVRKPTNNYDFSNLLYYKDPVSSLIFTQLTQNDIAYSQVGIPNVETAYLLKGEGIEAYLYTHMLDHTMAVTGIDLFNGCNYRNVIVGQTTVQDAIAMLGTPTSVGISDRTGTYGAFYNGGYMKLYVEGDSANAASTVYEIYMEFAPYL
ncbi:MAG: hypothetical protein ATN34_00015 [Epulopiscium sp. Nele67-Bin002]|nr:MAG: hypothetical protein ATN34_00015 [Epulopiscium sp. Nele67-Bin002]